MVQKYKFGKPFETEAVVRDIPCAEGMPKYGNINLEKGFRFTYEMQEKDMVYGLGEANRGINKRGFVYISNCTDDPEHTEDKNLCTARTILLSYPGKKPLVCLWITRLL